MHCVSHESIKIRFGFIKVEKLERNCRLLELSEGGFDKLLGRTLHCVSSENLKIRIRLLKVVKFERRCRLLELSESGFDKF